MKKFLFSALGLELVLALSLPILGASSADAATVGNQHRLHDRQIHHHHHHHHHVVVYYHHHHHHHHHHVVVY